MIEDFAQICAKENPAEKIRLLKDEESTYSLLGNYWLELADAYFERDQYKECLECVEKYKSLSIEIYWKDYNYLQIRLFRHDCGLKSAQKPINTSQSWC